MVPDYFDCTQSDVSFAPALFNPYYNSMYLYNIRVLPLKSVLTILIG